MIFKRNKQPDAVETAAQRLGLDNTKDAATGYLDGTPVVLVRPSGGVDPTASPGLWLLAGPTAENWITNTIPEASTDSVDRVQTDLYAGDAAAWLGLDVRSRRPYGDLDADQVEALARAAVAHLHTLY